MNQIELSEILSTLAWTFIPPIALTTAIGLIILAGMALSLKQKFKAQFIPFIFSFGLLGGTMGLIAGTSREPLVGALLTGIIALISALLSYLFSRESINQWREAIPFAVIYLMLSCTGGLSLGGIYKNKWIDYDKKYSKHLMEFEKVYLEVLKEKQMKEGNLGPYNSLESKK